MTEKADAKNVRTSIQQIMHDLCLAANIIQNTREVTEKEINNTR